MLERKYLIFVVASVVWAAVFYFMNMWIMQLQGLPVGADLMPL